MVHTLLARISVKKSKDKTKQLLAAKYQSEALRLAGHDSSTERRFLAVCLEKGKELEPVGSMTRAKGLWFVDTK